MVDRFGRTIDYMRLSITDRCNLRCRYCMPPGGPKVERREILRYEEFLQVAAAAAAVGITKFKVTGGEPLVRRGCVRFLRQLKALPGVDAVSLTTNGVLLAPLVPELADLGLDGVNISLDTPVRPEFAAITGFDRLDAVLAGIRASVSAGLRTKLNCVLLPGSGERVVSLARFAAEAPIDVRFIEVMPIGAGRQASGPGGDEVLERLRAVWPDLRPAAEVRGNGPAAYYASGALTGRIGIIGPLSRPFCERCNRVRLTSTGQLKPCLCYEQGTDLRRVLRERPECLAEALAGAILEKPRAHCFGDAGGVTEQKNMNQIGG